MTKDEIEAKLRPIIAKQLSMPEEKIVPEANFRDDLNADSLEMVDLIIAIEEEFGIQVSDEEAEKAHTVGDAVDMLYKKLTQEN